MRIHNIIVHARNVFYSDDHYPAFLKTITNYLTTITKQLATTSIMEAQVLPVAELSLGMVTSTYLGGDRTPSKEEVKV